MELNAMLQDLAETPAPPTTVDIARAAASGRRTVRTRRLLAAGSAALATVVVLGVLNMVLATGSALPPAPPPAAPSLTRSVPDVGPLPAQAPTSFDPMVQYATFGWLPVGNTRMSITTASDWLAIHAEYVGGPTSDGGDPSPGSISLIVVTAGHGVDPHRFGDYAVDVAAMPEGLDTTEVNGRKAQVVPGLGGAYGLRWEYAPGAWAMVAAGNVSNLDLKNTARQAAQSVFFGINSPGQLPYRTSGLPTGLSPQVVQTSMSGSDHWNVSVSYGSGPDDRTAYGDWPLTVLMMASTAEAGDGAVIGNPTTTVDGHPARTTTGIDGGSGLQLFNVQGVYIELMTHNAATTASLPGGLVGLFRSMEIKPDWTDRIIVTPGR